MKKLLFIVGLMIASNVVFGGGIITNTNQSAAWTRMLVRDASTEIDAVFYNPAGLTNLPDGFHFAISNQTILQGMSLDNSILNKEFKGEVFAPVYPNLYAAYKTGKFAFSLGFMPIGGGGSASYSKGVPMIELPVAATVGQLNHVPGIKINGYSMNANFDGSSVFLGLQGGVSYAINDIISVFAGARYVYIMNSYNGEMKDIKFHTDEGEIDASQFMNSVAQNAQAEAKKLQGAGNSMQPLINNKLGNLTFVGAVEGGFLTAEQRTKLEKGLLKLGKNNAEISKMTLKQVQDLYLGAATMINKKAAEVAAGAQLLAGQTADVEQTGSGITPIIGMNLNLLDNKLNIGIKYEFQTNIEVTNKTVKGKGFTMGFTPEGKPIEMFPDGKKTNSDLPAFLAIGAKYKITDKLSTQLGYHLYMDKNIGWAEEMQKQEDGKYKKVNIIDKNLWELGLGVEYQLNDKLLFSAGYLRGQTGVAETFNNDTRYSLTSNTYGLGGAYKINDMLKLQFGSFYVQYNDQTVNQQTYDKYNLCFSVGLDISLSK